MRLFCRMILLVLCVSLPSVAWAADPWEKFVGTYMGLGRDMSDNKATRDLEVVITPRDSGKGFRVEWTAVVYRADSTLDRRTMAVEFLPGGRDGVFGAAMRKDMFGQAVALDPLKGEPYVWSVIQGDTLIVHMLLILDDGAYQMQSYYRTLTPDGMKLVFKRTSGGVTETAVEADLMRAK